MAHTQYRTPLGVPGRIFVQPPQPPAGTRLPWHGWTGSTAASGHTRIGPRITVEVQDTWPPRVVVTVTDLTPGDTVTVYREVAGERTAVRSGYLASASDPSFVVLDAELPFGVAITYVAVIEGTDLLADPETVDLTGGKVALSDAIGGNAAEVVVLAWPEKAKARRSTVYPVGGRNVVVAGQRAGFNASIDFYTETETSRLAVDDLIEDATSGVVQIRQSGGYYGVDAYLAVLSDTEKRWSQDGSDERRIWTLEVVEVEGWSTELEAAGFTLEDLADHFSGQSLDQIDDEFDTLLAIGQADLS